ncbi:MAG: RNA polymerase sigma factor region1.1 domain-containing protein [Propionivibrio sp.]|nr:RNA polymerase sigma factor region1.1 domain-containing protein [Propionivibrio sp.]
MPDDVVDAKQIESIISTFNDMGIGSLTAQMLEATLMSRPSPAGGH